MSSAAKRRSGVLQRAVRGIGIVMEELETRTMLDALPNPSVPPPPLQVGTLPLQGLVGTPISLTPAMMRELYGLNQLSYFFNGQSEELDGTGQTIAIVGSFVSSTLASDAEVFDNTWGVSNVDSTGNFFLSIQPLAAGINTEVDTPANQLTDGEQLTMEVEWAHAMAPAAHILVVDAPSDSLLDKVDSDYYALAQPGVSVVCNAWNLPLTDPQFDGEQQRFDGFLATPANHQGVVDLFASGDNDTLNYPAASDEVIAVGGMTNNVTVAGDITTFKGWASSGGGSDNLYTPLHNVPLLSMDADPLTGVWVYDTQPGASGTFSPPILSVPTGWSVIGGTTLSVALFAGCMATIQQGLTFTGQATLDTATAASEMQTAGDALPYYFDTFPLAAGFASYPINGIPGSNHTGFGEPIFVDNGTDSNGQTQQGLVALLVGNGFTGAISYLSATPSNAVQHLGPNNEKATPITNWFFSAPNTTVVLDESDETVIDTLSFETEPQNTIAGQAVNGIIIDVNMPDGGGIDTAYNGAVTLTVTSGGTVTGVASVLAFEGRTVIPNTNTSAFSDVILDTEGVTVQLEASAGYAISATSTPFQVGAAAAATLNFEQLPSSTLQYATLTPVIVFVEDVFGNVVAGDYSVVSLSVASGPGTISGTPALNAENGVATFENLSFSTTGAYTLTASDTQDLLAPITSTSFTISAFPLQSVGTFNGARLSSPILIEQQQRNAGVFSNDGFGGLPSQFVPADVSHVEAASGTGNTAAVNNTDSNDSLLDNTANLRSDDAISDVLQ